MSTKQKALSKGCSMRWFLLALLFLPAILIGQSNFSFSGYTAGRTWTTNSYSHTNTQNGYTLTTRVSQNASPGWMNITGASSPNYATYTTEGCSASVTGLFLATDRSSNAVVVTVELGFSPAVCGPVTFRIFDINGEDVDVSLGYGFRDDVTITAYDQNNSQIALTTAMVTNNGTGNCGGGNYGASYVHTVGNSLKIVGCTYDNCEWDYFTITSSSKMIGRIVIDYASGNRDWYGTTISNPARQWVIVTDVRAWTPTFNITANCGSDPVLLTGSITSAFPPSTSSWGIPNASYPAVPAGNRPGAQTYSWTGTEGTFSAPTSLSTYLSGVVSGGGTFTLTGQNNRGCIATRDLGLNSANCLILPVELIAFEGFCDDKERVLIWSTASESNNDHFTLEQSEDAVHFTPVADIRGAGTSNELHTYKQNIPKGGGNYFRLKQVDVNGEYAYSRIILVPCQSPENFSVYPNPAYDLLNVEWQTTGKRLGVLLRDITGRIILNEKNELSGIGMTLDMSALSPGIYQAEFMDIDEKVLIANKKIVKL